MATNHEVGGSNPPGRARYKRAGLAPAFLYLTGSGALMRTPLGSTDRPGADRRERSESEGRGPRMGRAILPGAPDTKRAGRARLALLRPIRRSPPIPPFQRRGQAQPRVTPALECICHQVCPEQPCQKAMCAMPSRYPGTFGAKADQWNPIRCRRPYTDESIEGRRQITQSQQCLRELEIEPVVLGPRLGIVVTPLKRRAHPVDAISGGGQIAAAGDRHPQGLRGRGRSKRSDLTAGRLQQRIDRGQESPRADTRGNGQLGASGEPVPGIVAGVPAVTIAYQRADMAGRDRQSPSATGTQGMRQYARCQPGPFGVQDGPGRGIHSGFIHCLRGARQARMASPGPLTARTHKDTARALPVVQAGARKASQPPAGAVQPA